MTWRCAFPWNTEQWPGVTTIVPDKQEIDITLRDEIKKYYCRTIPLYLRFVPWVDIYSKGTIELEYRITPNNNCIYLYMRKDTKHIMVTGICATKWSTKHLAEIFKLDLNCKDLCYAKMSGSDALLTRFVSLRSFMDNKEGLFN